MSAMSSQHRHHETYDFSASLFCITKDVNMKKMPPALTAYTMLATLTASTPEYIILLDTDLHSSWDSEL